MPHVTRIDAGPPSGWGAFAFEHPALPTTPGKRFLGEELDLRSMEISLNCCPPGGGVPFAHRHRRHEEVYVFLSGEGELRVDEERFSVGPGTVVRVAPEGARAWRTTGAESLVFLVIQAVPQEQPVRTIADGVPEPLAPWS